MKHQVELMYKQLLETLDCPYEGCNHNNNGVCENTNNTYVVDEYINDELPSLDNYFTCNHCDTDSEHCPCGGRLELKPDIDEGRIYGYNHVCTNRNCILR